MSAPKVVIWRKWPDGEVVGCSVKADDNRPESIAIARVNALETFGEAVDKVRADWAADEAAARKDGASDA